MALRPDALAYLAGLFPDLGPVAVLDVGAHPIEHPNDADEMAVAPIGGEDVGRRAELPPAHQFDHRCIAGRPHLRA